MVQIAGRLLADLPPNVTVFIVFIASDGGEDEIPLIPKNVEAAGIVFMTSRLTPERTAALLAEPERNKVSSVQTSIANAVAEKFRPIKPQPETH
jgi:hypothetical protein